MTEQELRELLKRADECREIIREQLLRKGIDLNEFDDEINTEKDEKQ